MLPPCPSWSMIPPEMVNTTFPNCLEGSRLFVHFSMSFKAMSNLSLKRILKSGA